MNEIRPGPTVDRWRKLILILSMIAMLAGLLFSRALLSSGLIIFILLTLVHRNLQQQFGAFFSTVFLWSMSLLFFLPLISGLWSEDISGWIQILQIKLPLLLLPFCFAGIKNFKFSDWEKVAFSFLILISGGIGVSLWQYFQNSKSIHAGYLKAHIIETPVGNDHVRFSLLVVIAIFTAVFLLVQKGKNYKKPVSTMLLCISVTFVVYLHILAVRTGLVCFYIGIFALFVWLLKRRKLKIEYVLIFGFLVLLPVVSYFIFPTYRNRISYVRYDLSFLQKNIYVQGSNDGDRFSSIKAGWRLLNQHPLAGVGFGDIRKETDRLYEASYPTAPASDKILPSSEWMMYGAGTGWPGAVFFSCIMLVAFFVKELRKNIAWLLLNFFVVFSYLFDIGLEVQYGVFAHAFILLWWYKWLQVQR